jgi:hypothetical protein
MKCFECKHCMLCVSFGNIECSFFNKADTKSCCVCQRPTPDNGYFIHCGDGFPTEEVLCGKCREQQEH